jgi:hypothetical protein
MTYQGFRVFRTFIHKIKPKITELEIIALLSLADVFCTSTNTDSKPFWIPMTPAPPKNLEVELFGTAPGHILQLE